MEKIQENIQNNKSIVSYTNEELNYIMKPIGKALYKSGRPCKSNKEKSKPTDRIKCDLCSKFYFRSGKTKHCRTKVHIAYASMNSKLMKALIN